MTVNEYRKERPSCGYCKHKSTSSAHCNAINDYIGNSRKARRCPLYIPREYPEPINTMDKVDESVGYYLKQVMELNNHFSHTRRKDGADNE